MRRANPLMPSPPRMSRWPGCPCFWRSTAGGPWSPAGSPAAAWKAELLSAAGARGQGLCGRAMRGTARLAADLPRGAILHRTPLAGHADDFQGAAIAIGAFDNDEGAAHLRRRPRAGCRST